MAIHGQVKGATWPIKNAEKFGSMSAGLPHFAEGIWRCWGRDTLISLRGVLLLLERFDEATAAVKAFGSTLRHGLIPNLLGEGKVSRYNCRDATWFWLHSIKDIYNVGYKEILNEKIEVGFATDDSNFDIETCEQKTVAELMQNVLQRHTDGIEFRERNAGPRLVKNLY